MPRSELDAAWRRGAALTAPARRGGAGGGRGQGAGAPRRHRVASQLFELTGARSTSARYGFDRYWRNARVHTLHDPVDYKLRDLGRHALDGRCLNPTAYS
jgi:alkylation response protein AidB-like acyl-CoA dehydrogenase